MTRRKTNPMTSTGNEEVTTRFDQLTRTGVGRNLYHLVQLSPSVTSGVVTKKLPQRDETIASALASLAALHLSNVPMGGCLWLAIPRETQPDDYDRGKRRKDSSNDNKRWWSRKTGKTTRQGRSFLPRRYCRLLVVFLHEVVVGWWSLLPLPQN